MDPFIFFILSLTATVLIPVWPARRWLRMVCGVLAVPLILAQIILAHRMGNDAALAHISQFAAESEELLRDGNVEVVLKAYEASHNLPNGRSESLTESLDKAELLVNKLRYYKMLHQVEQEHP